MFEVLIFFILSVVIGLMFLFFGYPFFRILLPIWAFFAGLFFGLNGIESLLGEGFIPASLGLVVGFLVGAVLAALAYFVYSIAVYLFGVTAGYVLGSGLMMALGVGEGFVTAMVGIVVAVAFAVLFATTNMPRALIIFLTAAAGAMAVVMGLLVLFGAVPEVVASLELTSLVVAGSWFWLLVWLVVVAFGVVFQYGLVNARGEMAAESMYEAKKKK